MANHVPPIARVRLARSLGRLVRPSLLLVAIGGVAIAGGVLAPVPLETVARIGLVSGGAVLVLIAVWLAARMLTIRLEVEEAALRVRWLGGERVYPLTPGPVTRVRLAGEQASSLRARSGPLGWSLGRARLRGEETIEVVRLAPTPTAILVPTERGRLAIAPREEAELLDALARAARARQRLEDLATTGVRPEPGTADAGWRTADRGSEAPHAPAVDGPAPVPDGAVPATPADPEPRLLTGIERAMLEAERARQQAEEDARAAAAAEMRARAAEAAPVVGTDVSDGMPGGLAGSAGVPTAEPSARGRRWGRDRRAVTVPPSVSDVEEAADVDAPVRAPVVRQPRLRRRFAIGRPSAALVLLPLIAAGAVWGIASLVDRLPDAGTDLARIASLGLVLSGPATSIGAVMARAWWPRLVGVVVAGGLVATAFIGRALLGPN